MLVEDFVRKGLRLPSQLALLLGLGALSVAGARADAPETRPDSSGAASVSHRDVTVRAEGGKIYLREGGCESELGLGATPERDHLLRLLEKHGPAGVKLDADPRLIMSGGGGAGFSLRDITKSFNGKPDFASRSAPAQATPSNSPKQETRPRDNGAPIDKKG